MYTRALKPIQISQIKNKWNRNKNFISIHNTQLKSKLRSATSRCCAARYVYNKEKLTSYEETPLLPVMEGWPAHPLAPIPYTTSQYLNCQNITWMLRLTLSTNKDSNKNNNSVTNPTGWNSVSMYDKTPK